MTPPEAIIDNNTKNIAKQEKRSPSVKSSLIESSNYNFERPSASKDMPDLVCLSHLRWDFVYQRPQHLLTRCAKERRVFFIEEPIFGNNATPELEISDRDSGVTVVVPQLPEGLSQDEAEAAQQELIDRLLEERQIGEYILWYYTPMAIAFSRHLKPLAVIYDCMDELAAFKGASPVLKDREAELFKIADLVFTGGQSIYESKVKQHPNVYAFPSSIEVPHFAQARNLTATQPSDQADIPHPRLGFFGVIDERMDIELLGAMAAARPEWHFVIIGPVTKIDPNILPRPQNIHYLGGKSYQQLPEYIAGWDVALLPFAINESTRFISPTKTPEYLAAGKPVVSTSIRDVVRPYGDQKLVAIAETAEDFVSAADAAMNRSPEEVSDWLAKVDAFLAHNSWDMTWEKMQQLINSKVESVS